MSTENLLHDDETGNSQVFREKNGVVIFRIGNLKRTKKQEQSKGSYFKFLCDGISTNWTRRCRGAHETDGFDVLKELGHQ